MATGSFVPEEIVTNEDLAELGCDSDWIVRRTGIRERRRAPDHLATGDLCYRAALDCLHRAGVEPDELDLILVGTITPDYPTPSTACGLQDRLGAIAPAMDLSAACAGFMYGLVTGAQFIAAGNARRVLVVGADLMTRTIDPSDKKTYPLFGDAAGAVLLCPDADDGRGLLSYQVGSEGHGGDLLCIAAGGTKQSVTPEIIASGGHYMRMDGRGVFKWAVRIIADSAHDVLADAGARPEEISLVVMHQANQRIIDAAVSSLNVDAEKVFVNLDRFGNTSGASIPLALDEANRQGRIAEGDLVLLCGFGAGLAWGTALVRW